MHLGVNLRKAFLSGMVPDNEDEGTCDRKYHRVDTLVHEFCKLLGKKGVSEYTLGVVSFPDFLALRSTDTYYQCCSNIGSRYFVSAANACKILFLKDAAIEFLKFTGKDTGNKFAKLQDPDELLN